MDAWLAHLEAIRPTRSTTRTVVGRKQAVPSVSFDTHLAEAMATPSQPGVAHASWGEVYMREAGLLLTAPVVAPANDEDAPLEPLRVDPTHAA